MRLAPMYHVSWVKTFYQKSEKIEPFDIKRNDLINGEDIFTAETIVKNEK